MKTCDHEPEMPFGPYEKALRWWQLQVRVARFAQSLGEKYGLEPDLVEGVIEGVSRYPTVEEALEHEEEVWGPFARLMGAVDARSVPLRRDVD